MNLEVKTCKYCEEPILKGRSDKLYCDDFCRYGYHNENGFRHLVYKFYLENKDQFNAYVDFKIDNYTTEKNNIYSELEGQTLDQSDDLEKQVRLLEIFNELKQLTNFKMSIPKEEKLKKLGYSKNT